MDCREWEEIWATLKNVENHTLWFDAWLVLVGENRTSGRDDMVFSSLRGALVWYGSALAGWTIAVNFGLVLVLLVALWRRRGLHVRRWLAFNFTLVQLAVGVFVVPLNVITDRKSGWMFGGTVCRAWLLAQLLFVAETMWCLFALAFERFVDIVTPPVAQASSSSWLRCTSGRGGWKLAGVVVLATWAVSTLSVVPTWVSRHDEDFILEEFCAASMSPEHALFVTLAVFVAPAALTMIVAGAIAMATIRRSKAMMMIMMTSPESTAATGQRQSYSQLDASFGTSSSCSGRSKTATGSSLGSAGTGSVGDGGGVAAVLAIGTCCLLTWAPFYAVNVIIPFCEGRMCVDPTVWSFLIWLGYSTSGLAPIFWFVDPWFRRHARQLVDCKDIKDDDDDNDELTVGCDGSDVSFSTVGSRKHLNGGTF